MPASQSIQCEFCGLNIVPIGAPGILPNERKRHCNNPSCNWCAPCVALRRKQATS